MAKRKIRHRKKYPTPTPLEAYRIGRKLLGFDNWKTAMPPASWGWYSKPKRKIRRRTKSGNRKKA